MKTKTPTDWKQVEEVAGALNGAALSTGALERALYESVREAFPINEVPLAVCEALEDAAAHLRAADAVVAELGRRVVKVFADADRHADGTAKTVAETYSEEDVAARSSHRPNPEDL